MEDAGDHGNLAGPAALGRCGACGYDLRGLLAPRCPECGKAFDPDKVGRERGHEVSRAALWSSLALLVAIDLCVVPLLVVWRASGEITTALQGAYLGCGAGLIQLLIGTIGLLLARQADHGRLMLIYGLHMIFTFALGVLTDTNPY